MLADCSLLYLRGREAQRQTFWDTESTTDTDRACCLLKGMDTADTDWLCFTQYTEKDCLPPQEVGERALAKSTLHFNERGTVLLVCITEPVPFSVLKGARVSVIIRA